MPVYTVETPGGKKLDIEADNEEAAISAGDAWHEQNAPRSGVTEDVIKSAAIGPVKSAIGLVGGIPDISAAAHEAANKYLFDPLFNAISGPPQQGPQPYDINKAAGSEAIQKGLEGVTGPLYEPKTPQGQYAQSITEAGTGAALGPGGLAMKAGQALGAGIGSEAAGQYFKGGPLEGPARFAGGLAGGVTAFGGAKGVQALRDLNAAQTAGADISSVIGGPQLKAGAVSRVGQNIADEELTPQQVQAKSAALGPEAMLLDMGHQLEARADYMAQHSGKAQNTIYKPIAERVDGGASDRLNAVLDTHLGPPTDVVRLQNDIAAISNKEVRPAYQALEQKYPVVNDQRLQELAQRPAIAEAMTRAQGVAANYGESVSAEQPSLRFSDYTKKNLDQRINGLMRSGVDDLSSAQKADLGGLIKAKSDLVAHLDQATNGDYAAVRQLASTKPQMEDALDFGRSMFGPKLLPEQVREHVASLSQPEQEMVKIGARREIERVANSSGNEGRRLRNFLSTNNNGDKLETLLGPQARQQIENQLLAEDQFQGIKNKIEGTRTATRIAGMADTTAPTVGVGDIVGLPARAPLAAVNYALEHGMAGTRQDISRLLTARGNQVDPVVQALLGYNAQKAANAATPLSQQTQALIRALMSGGAAPQAPQQGGR